MTNANKLLEKAMSTNSDAEALACLRKAKKLSGGSLENIETSISYDYNKLYKLAVEIQNERDNFRTKYLSLSNSYVEVKTELFRLKHKVPRKEIITIPVIAFTLIGFTLGIIFF